MDTSNSIVVGTDLSESANMAVQLAAEWAAREQKRLVVAHVASDTVFSRLEVPRVSEALSAQVKEVAPAALDFEIVLESGSAHSRLISLADARRADLLVVGASGAGSVERLFFGSTAEQIVRYAHCPVLVARSSPKNGPIVAATDLSDAAAPAVARAAAEARLRGSELVLLHSLYEPPSALDALGPLLMAPPAIPEADWEARRYAAEETLKSLLATQKLEGRVIVLADAPVHAARQAASDLGAELIVVGTHGRSGLARVALGSVAERIVRDTPCSVLVVRLGTA